MLTPKHAKAISDISGILYDFLPGKPHPYAIQSISFKGIAIQQGLSKYWLDGSKLPSINYLLEKTYQLERNKFCTLIIDVINKGIIYRKNKKPVMRKEIMELNKLILVLDFKIPELWDKDFLDCLADVSDSNKDEKESPMQSVDYEILKKEFLVISKLEAHERGFAFEKYLNKVFTIFGLNPRSSFRIVGEQIDGSLDLDNECYLIEAKWQDKPCNSADLTIFHGKITRKSSWTRGIMISIGGFSKEAFEAFGRGMQTNLITLDGQDIYALLEKKIPLADGLRKKIRWAAETGEINKNFYELY